MSGIVHKCLIKMKELDMKHKRIDNSEYQLTIDYLFNNMTINNHKVLATLLDSWGDACH